MKTKLFFFAACAAAWFTSCNPDVQLGSDENIPEVAEHILGMTTQQAIKYLESQGFVLGSKDEYSNEYVFSREPNVSEFSYEASGMFMFGVFNIDTVKYASGVQRMKTEKSACDLYQKWSYYTAKVTMPKGTDWSGNITFKQNPDRQYPENYHEGSKVQQVLEQLEKEYKDGQITKESYDTAVEEMTSNNKDKFWSVYKQENEKENIKRAYERYKIPESTGHPKEVELNVNTNNGGSIELMYNTQDYETHWEVCE